jgi:hypothetical protein
MATNPAFAATPNNTPTILNSAISTSTTAPTNTVTIFTAGASGSKVEWIRIAQVATTAAAGTVNIFVLRSAVYYLLDFYAYGTATVSATANVPPVDFSYPYLELKSGDTLVAVNTVQSNTGATSGATHTVHAFGGDF